MPIVPDGFGTIFRFATLQFVLIGRIRLDLAWRLVFGKVEFFLDLALTAGQFLVAFLALEVRPDFGFQFFRPFVGVGNIVFEFGRTFLETLDVRFKRTNRPLRSICDPRCITVLAAHNHFNAIIISRTQKQIETCKASNSQVIAESVFDLLGTTNNQFTGNPTIVEDLSFQFDFELVPDVS